MINRTALEVLRAEFVFEVFRPPSILHQILNILGQKRVEISFRRSTLDRPHHAVERRHSRFFFIESLIDDCIQPLAKIGWRKNVQRAIEALEDRVIELSLLASIHLQLAIGVVVIDGAEDSFEQELLRAFAEGLELGRRERLYFITN